MHEGQHDVTSETVRALVDEQFPDWRHLPLRRIASAGTVNTIFRLGDDLTLRFPLTGTPGQEWERLRAEARASCEFAAVSPVPAPLPVALGEPGPGYPLPWSVQTWIRGRDGGGEDLLGATEFANGLADLLTALRKSDTQGRRFSGTGRGGDLADHDDWMAECFERSERLLDVSRLRVVWAHLRALPVVDEHVMTHGDLTPPNVLVHEARLAGVLDTGGFGPADPALDLVSVLHLLDAAGRGCFRDRLGSGQVQWMRGMAWAFVQAMGLVWYYADTNPIMSRWGRRTLDSLLAAAELPL